MSDDRGRERSFAGSFLRIMCPYMRIISLVFAMLLVFAALSLLSALAVPQSNPTYYIAMMTFALDGAGIVILGSLLFFCRRFHQRTI